MLLLLNRLYDLNMALLLIYNVHDKSTCNDHLSLFQIPLVAANGICSNEI